MNRINNFAFYVDICDVNKRLKIYLTVLDMMNQSYYGELQFAFYERLSNQLELTFDDCKSESISAITTHNGLPKFEYKFDDAASRFVWTKKIKGCPFGIYYGVVEMVPCERAATIMLYVNLVTNLVNHNPNAYAVSIDNDLPVFGNFVRHLKSRNKIK